MNGKLFAALLLLSVITTAARASVINPVPFNKVQITDTFWSQRIATIRNTTILHAFRKCDEAGQIRNFKYAGMIVSGEKKVGELTFQSDQPYDDAEVYKALEGAAYLLTVTDDPQLENYCDSIINIICSAQELDGYLQTNFTIHNPLHSWYGGEKWKMDWNLSHETFNVAELIECAIAYHQATGKDQLLKCAIKAADNMLSVFNKNGLAMAPGHAVVEMALVRLYEATGDEKYLEGCKFFLDCRGIRKFNPDASEQRENGKYWQDHLPAIEQRSAEGHAVRAFYFYSGMADWVRYSGDSQYLEAINAIWQNIASKKLYITGGFGARDHNEAFGDNYELPNSSAYCETCASVASVMFNNRMFRLSGHSRYIDMLERALYNTVLDGFSIHGDTFYYPNRLEVSSRGNERSPWFGTSCCPTNLCRLIPSVPGYIYATNQNSLFVNLYVSSTAQALVGNSLVDLTATTGFPYHGNVKLKMGNIIYGTPDINHFELMLRIPGWAVSQPVDSDLYTYISPKKHKIDIKVNGKTVKYKVVNGYAQIDRQWQKGDVVELQFPMDVHQVKSHPMVTSNHGLLSYERGPLVYCAEECDNNTSLDAIYIPQGTKFTLKNGLNDLFDGGVTQVIANGVKGVRSGSKSFTIGTQITLIPYFARAHRKPAAMKVWIPEFLQTNNPEMNYIDKVAIGVNETEHNLQGTNMDIGMELGWRHAVGGWMAYDMAVMPNQAIDLVIKQWGSDGGNMRQYDIYCDGVKFSSDALNYNAPNAYYFTRHAIPQHLTKGKSKVTIRLQAREANHVVGGVFGLYTTPAAKQ